MLVSIGSYQICDGTLSGGVAIGQLRIRLDRVIEEVVPLDDPITLFDRQCRKCEVTFLAKRSFANLHTCEKFILQLDTNIPASGDVTFTTTGPSPFTRIIANGALMRHILVEHSGALAIHQYTVSGGRPIPV